MFRTVKDMPDHCDQLTKTLLETSQEIFATLDYKGTVEQNIIKAKMLIDQGSDVNYVSRPEKYVLEKINPTKSTYKGPIGKTVLMDYALFGCTEMVDYILQKGGKKTINVRNFRFDNLGAYVAQESESKYSNDLTLSMEGYHFENAVSLAFCSKLPNSTEVVKLLLKNGADLSIFSDDEFYRPVIFCAVATFDNDDDSVAYIRPTHREKVKCVLEKMEQEKMHLTSCKETYKILSDLLSPEGYSFSKFKICTIL